MTDSISISPSIERSITSTPKRARVYVHRSIADRFWLKVNKTGPVPAHVPALGPCWVWTGGRDPAGYGQLRASGKHGRLLKAHRVSWSMHNGRLTDWMFVLHRCDNPSCVNPEHLFIGTQRDNVQDASRKGRLVFQAHPEKVRRGEHASAAKLTAAQVDEIRRLKTAGVTPATAIELLAAKIAIDVAELTEWCMYARGGYSDEVARGWSCAESNMGEHSAEWQAGYLARAIVTHDKEQADMTLEEAEKLARETLAADVDTAHMGWCSDARRDLARTLLAVLPAVRAAEEASRFTLNRGASLKASAAAMFRMDDAVAAMRLALEKP